jgi:acyl dehydratase
MTKGDEFSKTSGHNAMSEMQQAPRHEGQLYLDDLHVGQRFTSGSHLMEEARIKEFAAEFDPQPFHLDEIAAEASVFKGLAASGWHTAAVAMRLLVTGGLPLANGIVGVGGEIAWPRPTRPGDILHVESEIVEITPSRSKPHQGIVTVRGTTLNQHSEIDYVLTAKLLVPKRKT